MRGVSWFMALVFSLTGLALPGQDRLEPFPSRLLGRDVPIAIHEPSPSVIEAFQARHPGARMRLVLFLPGYFDGPKDFFKYGVFPELTRREQAGEAAPALWVAVTHYKSWYVDRKDGTFPFERFLREELLPALEARFPNFGGRVEARTVAGMSMGGLGALNLNARSGLFSRIVAISPALVEPPFTMVPWFMRRSIKGAMPMDEEAFRPWSPRHHKGGDADLHLASGTEDRHGTAQGVKVFQEMARKPGRIVDVSLSPGGHDWKYFGPEILRQAAWAGEPVYPAPQ